MWRLSMQVKARGLAALAHAGSLAAELVALRRFAGWWQHEATRFPWTRALRERKRG